MTTYNNGQTPTGQSSDPATSPPGHGNSNGSDMAERFLRDALLENIQDTPAPASNQWQSPAQPQWQQPPAHQQWDEHRAAPPQRPSESPAPAKRTPKVYESYQELMDAAGLTDDEKATYAESMPLIHKLLRTQVSPLVQELEQLRAATDSSQHASENDFINRVRQSVKHMDAMTNDPRWQTFLSSKVPGTPFRYSEALSTAHHSRDLDSVADTFRAFAQSVGQAAPAPTQPQPFRQPSTGDQWRQPTGNPPSSVTPNTGSSGSAVPHGSDRPLLKWSTYDEASKEYIAGRLPRDQFMRVKGIYDPAIAEGRVVFDN